MAYRVIRPGELEWTTRPHEPDEPARHVAELSELAGFAHTRANVWRYPPGAQGKRHRDLGQEEVFVVLDGTLTVDLGDPPERHEVSRGGVVVVERGTILQLRNAGDEEVVLFIYGAPPETGKSEFFDPLP